MSVQNTNGTKYLFKYFSLDQSGVQINIVSKESRCYEADKKPTCEYKAKQNIITQSQVLSVFMCLLLEGGGTQDPKQSKGRGLEVNALEEWGTEVT